MAQHSDKIRCLLVDDDIDDRELFLMALHNASDHIDCRTASNGVEALELLEQSDTKPDFIFLDVNMHKMNGLDCLDRIRQMEELNRTRIYIYSTTSSPEVIERSRRQNARFIVKPHNINSLREMLEGIFHHP
jgi:CheY-like chemotaxis protein